VSCCIFAKTDFTGIACIAQYRRCGVVSLFVRPNSESYEKDEPIEMPLEGGRLAKTYGATVQATFL